jgi:hypothetical protein
MIVFMVPTPSTPPRHEPLPEQVTLQGLPPHEIAPVHALSPQRIVQLVASLQSTLPGHPDAGQSIEHGMSFGQRMSPGHGLHAVPQANVQTPLTQLPPASMHC